MKKKYCTYSITFINNKKNRSLSLALFSTHGTHKVSRFQGFIELLAPGPSTHGTH